MSGLIFIGCKDLERTRDFYTNTIGMKVWLEQPQISILRHGNLLVGFQEAGEPQASCLITFFYDTNKEVDAMYERLKDKALAPPKVNEKFKIYNFFARDPEGRDIEFQCFQHPVEKEWDD